MPAPDETDPRPTDLEVAEMVAWVALRRLQSRYADIVTRRAWPELAGIMRPDCVITVDVVDRALEFHGPGAIGDFIGTQLEQFDFFEFVILNTVIDIDPTAGTATARMYMQEARQDVADGRRSDTYGVYHDRFARDADGRWWFARRRYRSYARTDTSAEAGRDLVVFDLPELDLDGDW
jgi:hypothetical protein